MTGLHQISNPSKVATLFFIKAAQQQQQGMPGRLPPPRVVGNGALGGTYGSGAHRHWRLRLWRLIVNWLVNGFIYLSWTSLVDILHAVVHNVWRCLSLLIHAFGLWFDDCCQAALARACRASRPEAAVLA